MITTSCEPPKPCAGGAIIAADLWGGGVVVVAIDGASVIDVSLALLEFDGLLLVVVTGALVDEDKGVDDAATVVVVVDGVADDVVVFDSRATRRGRGSGSDNVGSRRLVDDDDDEMRCSLTRRFWRTRLRARGEAKVIGWKKSKRQRQTRRNDVLFEVVV